MTPEQAHLLQLALRPREASHDKSANYYLARKGTEEDLSWLRLKLLGYAEEYRDSISVRTWRVTVTGKAALTAYLGKLHL